MKNKLQAILIIGCMLMMVIILNAQNKTKSVGKLEKNVPTKVSTKKDNYKYKVIESFEGTFGYDIYKNEALLIHQPNIPTVQGNKGFKTTQLAERIAKLVISKLVKGEMPPTIKKEELKKFGI